MISNVGTTNSLTGVYASLCSLPLYGGYQENGAKDDLVREKICLGHILNSFNYQQMSIQGTSETNIYTQSFKKIFDNNKITFNGCHELIAKGYKPSKTSFDGCLHNQDILQETEQQLIAFRNQDKRK